MKNIKNDHIENRQQYHSKIAKYLKTVEVIGGHDKFVAKFGVGVSSALGCAKDAFDRHQADEIIANWLYVASERFSSDCDLFSDALVQA